MDRTARLVERLRRRPRDFTWEELTTLLRRLGFRQVRPGRTAGSRRRFIHPDGCVISLHEPHPARVLKRYQLDQIIDTLERDGLI